MDKEKWLPLFLSNTFDSKRLVENKMDDWQVIEHENKFRIIKESRRKVFDIHFNMMRLILLNQSSVHISLMYRNLSTNISSLLFEI